jgi:hypothetical protein
MFDMDYQAPKITDLGELLEITAGQADGEALDRDFPTGTPKSDLTFS